MFSLVDIALRAAFGLFLLVALALVVVMARQGVRTWLLSRLRRRVKRAQLVLAKHRPDDYGRVDRLLHQLTELHDDRAVELAIRDLIAEGGDVGNDGLRDLCVRVGLADQLREELRSSKSWSKRVQAARALGHLQIHEAIPDLVTRMRDPQEDASTVRREAARALAAMDGREAIPLLIRELDVPDDWASPRVAEALLLFGSDALPALLDGLSPEATVNRRVWCCQILGRLGDTAATSPLMQRLSDPSEQVRLSAAEALGCLRDRRAVAALTQLAMHDPVPPVRAEGARALGLIGDASVMDELVFLLSSSDHWTRLRAVEAIEHLRPSETGALEAALEDESELVRAEAARALERLGVFDRLLGELQVVDPKDTGPVFAALANFGRAGALDAVLRGLTHDDFRVRARVCQVVAQVGSPRSAEHLVPLLTDAEWPVRVRAVEAVSDLNPPDAFDRLVPCLVDSEATVRSAAIRAIAHLDGARTAGHRPMLVELFRTGTADARAAVIGALRHSATQEVEELIRDALDDPAPEVRLAAVRSAKTRATERWLDRLVPLLGDADARVRRYAAEAIGSAAPEAAITVLAACVNTPDYELREVITSVIAGFPVRTIVQVIGTSEAVEGRLALCWALGKSHSPEAVDVLHDLARDPHPSVRAAAAGALRKIPAGDVLPALASLLSDPDPRVRAAAINSTAALGGPAAERALRACLDDANAFVRGRLALAFGRLAESGAFDMLMQLYEGAQDWDVRAHALVGMGLLDEPATGHHILSALRDDRISSRVERILAAEDPSIRARFRDGLGVPSSLGLDGLSLGHLRDRFAEQLRQGSAEQRQQAVTALGSLGPSPYLSDLTAIVLADPDPAVRMAALHALAGTLDREEVRAAVRRAAADPVSGVQATALTLLAKIAEPEWNRVFVQAAVTGEGPVLAAAVEALTNANRGRGQALLNELEGLADPREAAVWARALRCMGDPTHAELLREWTRSEDAGLRSAAIEAIVQVAPPEAASALLKGLALNPDEATRLAAVNAMPGIEDHLDDDFLSQITQDPSARVRMRVAHVLARKDNGPRRKYVRRLASDPVPDVRIGLLLALLEAETPQSLTRFIDTWSDQPEDVRSGARGRARRAGTVERLHGVLSRSPDPGLRLQTLRALAVMSEAGSTALVRGLRDPAPSVRKAVLQIAKEVDDPAVRDAVEEVREDPSSELRRLARQVSHPR